MAADLSTPTSRGDPVAGLQQVRGDIAAACRRADRDPASVTLVAVTKTFPAAAIEPVIAQRHRVFGENRVQEARAKWPPLVAQAPDIELHLIGPLQTNKVKEAFALFDVIHTIDREALCEAIVKEMARQPRRPKLLVQVNTGAEPQKAGVLPEATDAFVASCRKIYGLSVAGLMCIPPVDEPPAPHFALLAKLAARNGLELLSMGMSADYGLAIELGATHVRVGSAIFGART